MDPNATRDRILHLAWKHRENALDASEVLELTDLLTDLDLWLTNGGQLPDTWSR